MEDLFCSHSQTKIAIFGRPVIVEGLDRFSEDTDLVEDITNLLINE